MQCFGAFELNVYLISSCLGVSLIAVARVILSGGWFGELI
jgi:hypothetical protein